MKNRKGKYNFVVIWLIALLTSAASIFCIPDIVDAGMGKTVVGVAAAEVGLIVVSIAAVCLTALLRFGAQKSRKENYFASLRRVVCTVLFYCSVAVIMSILSGVFAVVLYGLLKSLLAVGQIKGIIDFLVSSIMLLVLPFLISVFWKQINHRGSFRSAIREGICMAGKKYLGLLIMMFVTMGIGWLILTMFHYMPKGIWFDILKMLLFSGIGVVMLNFSESLCN